MEYESVIRFTTTALVLALMVSLPVVGVTALAGLLIAFFQAILSLQDSSVSQGLKLVIAVVVLMIAAPWGASAILQFACSIMEAIFV
ncbi:type III secretion system export apparatus subunit SctS [Uliginosibacterium gangwonense]|uniref:type III secretion system export apparatus subunit SctS n=1 Tax=Uliginosibacterium gangwonense TaxID=392736 RepID=UPI00036D1D2C|nr:type III secretion system export apparatus subunit SctS [Uliginosibacterium gangwonense]